MIVFNKEKGRMEYIRKAMDPSHGGKLIKKIIIDKNGHKQTKWVQVNKDKPVEKINKIKDKPTTNISSEEVENKAVEKTDQNWWADFKKYNLNAYPIGVDKKDVEVDESGDVNSHWILRWKDPKTGKLKNSYSKEFLDRNAEYKWQRIEHISSKQINKIKQGSKNLINKALTGQERDAAAIVNIIAQTGLRRGDRVKFAITGNRGVSTISPENVNIIGNKVILNFIGKSYKENVSTINDPILAEYLQNLKDVRKGEQFLFTSNDATIDKVFNSVGGENLKLKDLRTYVATDLAKKILFEDKTQPPPIPPQLSVTKKKKLIKDKLNRCYELVSQKLNNTPAMAKNAYIHPNVITKWIETLAIDFEISKSVNKSKSINVPLDEVKKQFPASKNKINIQEQSEELCDFFNDPLEKI